MVKVEGGSMPLCVWSQKEEKAVAKVKAEVEISKDIGGLADPSKLLCARCKQKLPASFLVQAMEAMEAGWLSNTFSETVHVKS